MEPTTLVKVTWFLDLAEWKSKVEVHVAWTPRSARISDNQPRTVGGESPEREREREREGMNTSGMTGKEGSGNVEAGMAIPTVGSLLDGFREDGDGIAAFGGIPKDQDVNDALE